jgi:hypothetical protein
MPYTAEDFTKTLSDVKIALCPSDSPHPHRLNRERFKYGYGDLNRPYDYSYGEHRIACWPVNERYYFHVYKNTSSQMLLSDSLDFEIANFRARYLEIPDCSWDQPYWYSNTIGYFHSRAQAANIATRDLSVKTVNYGFNGNGIDTNDIFFWKRGESLDRYFETAN